MSSRIIEWTPKGKRKMETRGDMSVVPPEFARFACKSVGVGERVRSAKRGDQAFDGSFKGH